MRLKMCRGEKAQYFANKFDTEAPEVHIVGGPRPYLWIGGENGPCYATLSGNKTLIKLAESIIKAVNKDNPNYS